MTMNESNMRRTWMVAGSIAAVIMLGFGTIQAVGLVAREESTVRQEFDAAELAGVEVTSDNGDVRVIGDETTTVRVVIRLEQGWSRIDRVARVEGDRLVLSASCPFLGGPFCSADYEVHVPPGIAVAARSDNGDASVTDVDGDATVSSSNGDVAGSRLGGVVRLGTDNGNVEGLDLRGRSVKGTSSNGDVELNFDLPPADVEVESSNGDVEVVVPRGDELYAVDATTDNGDARTPVRTDPSGRRRIVARSDNGDVTVRYP